MRTPGTFTEALLWVSLFTTFANFCIIPKQWIMPCFERLSCLEEAIWVRNEFYVGLTTCSFVIIPLILSRAFGRHALYAK